LESFATQFPGSNLEEIEEYKEKNREAELECSILYEEIDLDCSLGEKEITIKDTPKKGQPPSLQEEIENTYKQIPEEIESKETETQREIQRIRGFLVYFRILRTQESERKKHQIHKNHNKRPWLPYF